MLCFSLSLSLFFFSFSLHLDAPRSIWTLRNQRILVLSLFLSFCLAEALSIPNVNSYTGNLLAETRWSVVETEQMGVAGNHHEYLVHSLRFPSERRACKTACKKTKQKRESNGRAKPTRRGAKRTRLRCLLALRKGQETELETEPLHSCTNNKDTEKRRREREREREREQDRAGQWVSEHGVRASSG